MMFEFLFKSLYRLAKCVINLLGFFVAAVAVFCVAADLYERSRSRREPIDFD